MGTVNSSRISGSRSLEIYNCRAQSSHLVMISL